jgi:hydroxypyruvate reductase
VEIRDDAKQIIQYSIDAVLPDQAVIRALRDLQLPKGKLYVVALGKAAWQMAKTAEQELHGKIDAGVVITKYGYSGGELENFRIFEAGHPVPDENSFTATRYAVSMVEKLQEEDMVILLISGGGSSLFEIPLCTKEALQDVTKQLLACGADITEMNVIRKRLSAVKGGKFARICKPAHVFAIVLSDIIGSPLDMIASGPAYPDASTTEEAKEIVKKYDLDLPEEVLGLLEVQTPKTCDNVTTVVTGSVEELCHAAAEACRKLGYRPILLTSSLNCIAREAGSFLASIAREYQDSEESLAFLAGGETVVQLTGTGLGGRNQELALSAAEGIRGLKDTVIFSVGSDGTDGPTDAAGGIVDGETAGKLDQMGWKISETLRQNDSYHALEGCGGLIKTGPTGTNVNDVSCLLIRR